MQFVQLINSISKQDNVAKSNIMESGELEQKFQNLLDSLNVSNEKSKINIQLKDISLFSLIGQKLHLADGMSMQEFQDLIINNGEYFNPELLAKSTLIDQVISQKNEVDNDTNLDAATMILSTVLNFGEQVIQSNSVMQSTPAFQGKKTLSEDLNSEVKKVEFSMENENDIVLKEITISENEQEQTSENNNFKLSKEENLIFHRLVNGKKNSKDDVEKKQLMNNLPSAEIKDLLENKSTISKNDLITNDKPDHKTDLSSENIKQLSEQNAKASPNQEANFSNASNDKQESHILKETKNSSADNQGNLTQDSNDINSSKLFVETLEKGSSFKNGEAQTPTVSAKDIPDYFLKQISSKVKFNKLEGTSELNVKLKPDYLGKLTLKLTSHEGQVAVKIITETTHAREFVEQNIQQLKQNLINQGIKCSAIDVQLGGDSNFNFLGQFKNPFSQSKYYSNKNKSLKNNKYEMQNEGIYSIETGTNKSGLSELELLA